MDGDNVILECAALFLSTSEFTEDTAQQGTSVGWKQDFSAHKLSSFGVGGREIIAPRGPRQVMDSLNVLNSCRCLVLR